VDQPTHDPKARTARTTTRSSSQSDRNRCLRQLETYAVSPRQDSIPATSAGAQLQKGVLVGVPGTTRIGTQSPAITKFGTIVPGKGKPKKNGDRKRDTLSGQTPNVKIRNQKGGSAPCKSCALQLWHRAVGLLALRENFGSWYHQTIIRYLCCPKISTSRRGAGPSWPHASS
jgi:hypothetical protein